jgi:hypothetical protein
MRTRSESGYVRLVSARALLVAALTVQAAGHTTSRVSVATDGAQGDGDSEKASVSPTAATWPSRAAPPISSAGTRT